MADGFVIAVLPRADGYGNLSVGKINASEITAVGRLRARIRRSVIHAAIEDAQRAKRLLLALPAAVVYLYTLTLL